MSDNGDRSSAPPHENPAPPDETITNKVVTLQKIIDDAVRDKTAFAIVANNLRAAGASVLEAQDYLDDFTSRSVGGSGGEGDGEREGEGEHPVPSGPRDAEANARAVEDAQWDLLLAKAAYARTKPSDFDPGISPAEFYKLLGGSSNSSSSTSIPTSVLDAAPHLRTLAAASTSDDHLSQTWKLRATYSGKDTIEGIVNLMQDLFVDFEKLFAAIDPAYDHHDDPKELSGEFVVVKKDQLTAKKALRTEADWIHVYLAWRSGVLLVYPHRKEELAEYAKIVGEVFRASPHDPANGIRFDDNSRRNYGHSPYHLNDRSRTMVTILGQLFRGTKRVNETPTSTSKAKRPTAICHNWNLNICREPCPNRRKHGYCSECGGKHRARDNTTCHAELQARLGEGSRKSTTEGAGGGSSKA
ncbi:hypothetical protein CPB83DRAFT_865654 [Crepidotus variabilis]|uniref:Uncharacterized protein n=1 Tax=Crepidotus variabilis TaxID=179855 RepID=A0A9P6ESH8_9AGAR|nr:hypothetical protein CPB83DRAFT_865654 [Crepidotus variabilis]